MQKIRRPFPTNAKYFLQGAFFPKNSSNSPIFVCAKTSQLFRERFTCFFKQKFSYMFEFSNKSKEKIQEISKKTEIH